MLKLINRFKNYTPSISESILYLFIPILFTFLGCKTISNDLWFMINIGKYITKNGFFYTDPFTIHKGLHVVVQQWPVDLLFYHIYNFLGITGIYILTISLFFLIMFLIYKICNLVSNNTKVSIFATSIISTSLILFKFVETRPQLFDYIFLLIEIYILENYIRNKKYKLLFFLPIISILYINIHASTWFMLILFMLPFIVDSFNVKIWNFKFAGYPKKWIFITFILMILGGLINPYGLEAMTYIFNGTSNTINIIVAEMRGFTYWGFMPDFLIVLFIYIVFLIYKRNIDNIKIRYLCLNIGTIILALKYYRAISFFLLSLTLLASYFKCDNYKYDKKSNYKAIKIVSLLSIISFIIICIFVPYEYICYGNFNKIALYLEKNVSKDAIIYSEYDIGAYIEYLGYKTNIDPRAELFNKAMNKRFDIIDEYYDVQVNKNIDKFIKKYKFDYLIVSSDRPLNYYLNSNRDYKLVLKQKCSKEKRFYMLYKFKTNS